MKELIQLLKTDPKAFLKLFLEGFLLMAFLYMLIWIAYILQP